MITQEMVEAIQSVPLNISSTRRGGENGLRNAEEVLAAVYPLILEQAATICGDKWLEYASEGHDNVAFGCNVCEKAIRNLKDKTDE